MQEVSLLIGKRGLLGGALAPFYPLLEGKRESFEVIFDPFYGTLLETGASFLIHLEKVLKSTLFPHEIGSLCLYEKHILN
jgi:hypothetical protein